MRTSILVPAALVAGLSLALLIGFCACGKPTDPKALTSSGYAAIASGDYKGALDDFNSALKQLGDNTEEQQYMPARLGAVEARMHLEPKQACEQFLELAKAVPSKVTDRDYGDIAGKFATNKNFLEAIQVIEAGKKAWPESPKLAKTHKGIMEMSERSGDSQVLDELRSLGYLAGGK